MVNLSGVDMDEMAGTADGCKDVDDLLVIVVVIVVCIGGVQVAAAYICCCCDVITLGACCFITIGCC